jgi:hypothetical protein
MKIDEIAKRMQGQDNRGTAHPIYLVQEKQEVYDPETGCVLTEIWSTVQPFFSEKSANNYIKANRHNLISPFVYVASAYGNWEWQAVREYLMKLESAND